MEPWLIALLGGALGGLVNAMLEGGEHFQVRLPGFKRLSDGGRVLELSVVGSILLGAVTAVLVSSLGLLNRESVPTFAAAVLAGLGSTRIVSGQLNLANMRGVAERSADAASAAADVVEKMTERVSADAPPADDKSNESKRGDPT